jgi:cobalt-zinc-cadmium efflux system membrane fusion protein
MKAPREDSHIETQQSLPSGDDDGLQSRSSVMRTLSERPRKRLYVLLGSAGLLVIVAAVLTFRGGHKAVAGARPPEVALEGSHIRFSEAFARRHRIQSVKVAETELSPMVSVTGTVRHDPRKFAAVGARSAGRIRRVYKIMGDRVKPGEILADIESADLGRAQANAEALRAKEIVALSNFKREEQLTAARVTAAREAELARADHEALRAERRAAEKAVAALGAGVSSEVGILKLRSPIAGRVIKVEASQGQTIEPSDTLFEVADLSTVWVELVIFERDLDRVHAGDTVEIIAAAAKGNVLKGTLAQLGDLVDPTSRSAIGRVEVDNREGWLRPGQSTTARIHGRAAGERALTVPRASVTFVDGKPTAFLLVSPGLVEPHAVELGADDGERVAIRHGLRAGDDVINDGLFALKSEIFR